jgi:hypothetical protein
LTGVALALIIASMAMLRNAPGENRRRPARRDILVPVCAAAVVCLAVVSFRAYGARRDLRAVCRLLREGADPHAPWSGYDLRSRLERLLKREPWKSGDVSILEWSRSDHRIEQLMKTPIAALPDDAALAVEEAKRRLDAALIGAAMKGDIRVISQLLGRGARINGQDSSGRTALIYALNNQRAATVEYLLARGADPNVRTSSGHTALFYGDSRLCSRLIRAGADVNARDALGDTALAMAARCDSLDRVALLLRHGADPNLHVPNGPSALDWALDHKNRQMIDLLRKAGGRVVRRPAFRAG